MQRNRYRGTIESLEQRLLFQLTPIVAEQLAREVAYRDWNAGAQVTFEGSGQAANLPYTVSDVWHDSKTGFDAYGLTSTENGPCLVLRGSEFFPSNFKYKDLLSDANPKGIGYDQFAANWMPAMHSVRAWLKAQNASVDFVGHSLGGALAQWFAAAWSNVTDNIPGASGKPVDLVFTFCSSGISDSRTTYPNLITYASDSTTNPPGFNDARANGVKHYIALGDIVSMAGEKYIKGDVITYQWRANLQLKHIEPFLNDGVKPLPTEGVISKPDPAPVAGTLTLATLNSPNYVHNDPDYRAFVTSIQILANGLAAKARVLRPLRLVPPLFMRRGNVEASRKVLGEFLNKTTGNMDFTIENDVYKLTLGGQTGPLYQKSIFYLDSIQITLDNSGPNPTLVATGNMRIRIPVPNFQIPIPAILGGPINVGTIIEIPTNVGAMVDQDKLQLSTNQQISVLGGMFNVSGNIVVTFDWTNEKITVGGDTNFLNGFVTTAGSTTIDSSLNITGNGDADLTMPAGLPLVGGKPLANGTFDFGFFYGNLGASYLEGIGTFRPWIGPTLRAGARVTLNGGLTVIAGNRRIRVFVRDPFGGGSPGPAGFDVPSNHELLVMQASWQNPSSSAQIRVTTSSGQTLDEAQIDAHPDFALLPELSDSFSRTVLVKFPPPGTWQIELVDANGLGTTDFVAFIDSSPVTLTFDPITGGTRREDVHIHLNIDDPLGSAKVALYYDNDDTDADGQLIAGDLSPVNGAIDYTWNVADVPTGDQFIYAVVTPEEIPAFSSYAPSPVHITEVRPTLVSGDFNFDRPHAVEVRFDQDVASSIALADFTLTNLTTSSIIPSGQLTFSYDEFLNIATLRTPGAAGGGISGILPDGSYRLSADAASISNSDGETLASNLEFNFFFLNGDANRDGAVSLNDFNILTGNFGTASGATFDRADFNYDGSVSLFDFNILAQKFGSSVGPGASTQRQSGSMGRAGKPFSDQLLNFNRAEEDVLMLALS